MNFLDYPSLLAALSFCSAGMALTFFVSWFVMRTDRYLQIWAFGTTFLVVSILTYWSFITHFSPIMGIISFSALEAGLVFLYGAAHQFRTGILPKRRMLVMALSASVITSIPMALGYDGICYIIFNIFAFAFLAAAGLENWRCRMESPLLLETLAILYVVGGVSFGLCAAALVVKQSWVMHHAPDGWVENLNLIVCLADTAAIGALSLALNQLRVARRHKRDAETDVLTGLLNRRAFFEKAKTFPTSESAIAIVFDIDHFKSINDRHGHQLGDTVLETFAGILADAVREGDLAARLGGEEFSVLLPNASVKSAVLVAERVREKFGAHRIVTEGEPFYSTVSAGISKVGTRDVLDELMVQADAALYVAKRSGRNRVIAFTSREDVKRQKSSAELILLRDPEVVAAAESTPETFQSKERFIQRN